jgi:hypothetical protein
MAKPVEWFVYRWDRMGRKGELCTVLIRSRRMNSIMVEFEDGHQAITSARAVAPAKPGYRPAPKLNFGA